MKRLMVNGTPISFIVREISEDNYDGIMITTKLLSGAYQYQTVGKSTLVKYFTIICTEEMAERVNRHYDDCGTFVLQDEEREYRGKLMERPQWKRVSNGWQERKRRKYEARLGMACEVIE